MVQVKLEVVNNSDNSIVSVYRGDEKLLSQKLTADTGFIYQRTPSERAVIFAEILGHIIHFSSPEISVVLSEKDSIKTFPLSDFAPASRMGEHNPLQIKFVAKEVHKPRQSVILGNVYRAEVGIFYFGDLAIITREEASEEGVRYDWKIAADKFMTKLEGLLKQIQPAAKITRELDERQVLAKR